MGKIKPHKTQYWLNSSDKLDNPKAFDKAVAEICQVYEQAPVVAQAGHYTISVDEKTGIQALERLLRPAIPGMAAQIEFEYKRHGTITLIGFFNVATGQMINPFLNPTRKENDFVSAIKTVIDTDSDKNWTFIADQLNTHMSENLVRLVADYCKITDDLGVKGKSGILKNKETRKAFLSDKSHRIRFVYTPKHCSWMNQIEIWFSILSRKLLNRSSYASVSDLKESILRFIRQQNLIANPFKWTYKGTPLTT